MALVARVAYAELDGDNLLVVNNAHAIAGRNTAEITLRNSTIADNSSYSEGKFTIFTFENDVFAFNGGSIIEVMSPTDLSVRNSLFQGVDASGVVGYLGEDAFRRGGNLTGDPLFVDHAAGNYELAPGSPAIDAGRGIGASAIDFLGRPRYDDPGMANIGAGSPSYVDIGAFERQEPSPAADLAVTKVSDPAVVDVHPGDSVTITWTVTNTGERDLTGSWQDTVYLSSDPYLSLADDHLLGRVSHSSGLDKGAVYNGTWSGQIPAGVAGPQYILVYTNDGAVLRESSLINNVLSSQIAFAVDVPVLTTAAPQTDTIAQGQWKFFRYDAQPGLSVRFALDAAAGSGATQLYVRRGAPPTVSVYDFAGAVPNQPDQEARLLNPAGGSYYIGVFAQSLPGGPSSFTLSAELTNLDVRSVSSNRVGNAGRATVKIVGDNFTRKSQAALVAPDGSTVEGDEWFQDASALFATFDLAAASAAPGLYDVVITDPGVASFTDFDALTVDAGGAATFVTNLVVPGQARPNRTIEVRVEYSNTGNVDLASPLLTLESSEGAAWRLPGAAEDDWIEGTTVSFLAIGSDGPASVLRPGQSESIVLTARTPFAPGDMPFTLYSFGAGRRWGK